MKEHKSVSKSIIAVSLSLALVFILVIALFISGQREKNQTKIQLPDPYDEDTAATPSDTEEGSHVLGVDNQNVLEALSSIDNTDYYHQRYSIEVGNGTDIAKSEIELWVCGNLKRAEVVTARNKKIVISNGKDLWLWYTSDPTTLHVQLKEDLTFEDVLGLPAFDYLNSLQTDLISEAEYLILEEGKSETACIFLSTQRDEYTSVRYWISLENGLLYEADAMENSTQIYHVRQTSFDLLAAEDEAFLGKFDLPDGTSIDG